MRHLLLILTLVLTTGSLCAQEQKIITKEDNNTFKVVLIKLELKLFLVNMKKEKKLEDGFSEIMEKLKK